MDLWMSSEGGESFMETNPYLLYLTLWPGPVSGQVLSELSYIVAHPAIVLVLLVVCGENHIHLLSEV